MNLQGRKIIVNKSAGELASMLRDPENYRALMPDDLQKFETTADGFRFSIKGMPEVALKIDEVTDQDIKLVSAMSGLDFKLDGKMTPAGEIQTEAQLLFEGKFNPFIRMMAEKPLKNFLDSLTDKIEKL